MDNPEKLVTLGTQDTGRRQITQKPCTQLQMHMQANTNNVKKTEAALRATGGKYEPNIVFMRKS